MSNLETFWIEPEWMDDCVVNKDSRGRRGFLLFSRFSWYISPSQEGWRPGPWWVPGVQCPRLLGRGSLHGHREEKQSHEQRKGSRSRLGWGRFEARGQLEEKEVTWSACCVGRQGGMGRTLLPTPSSCFLREASQGRRLVCPQRSVQGACLWGHHGGDPSGEVEA